jgi:ABC-type transport system involved in cytochrome c biogenesis permease subunit
MNSRRLLCVLWILIFAATAGAVDFRNFEKTPIQEGGRKKPFSTFATETLQTISGKTAYLDGNNKMAAMDALFSMWLHPDDWQHKPVVLVNYGPLRKDLGLAVDQKLFSLADLIGNTKLQQQIASVQDLQKSPEKPKLTPEQSEVRDVANRLTLLETVLNGSVFAFVPPQKGDRWLTVDQIPTVYPGDKGATLADAAKEMIRSYDAKDDAAFLSSTEKFSAALAQLNPAVYPSAKMMSVENTYGKVHPFRWAWALYATAAILLGLTSLWARNTGYKLAWAIVLAGFALQVFGFVCRVIIGGRGPVTNMYESVIWVAFGTILFAMILEAVYRCRYFFIGATPLAVVALILADTQSTVLNPAIHPLTPVLRNNFWLSTHVTSITLSYAAFFLALGVGHIILIKILMGRQISSALYNYLYRSLQIGVLLLAIGTILGGVWANYSWGRFWGWDPKETWALIALLGYLALLHGRIAGWWKGFGLAVGSILGFQSVLMAWYGVNFVLGQGLHSYGFGTGGFPYVLGYVIAELAFVGVVIARKSRGQTAVDVAPVEMEHEAA